MKKFIISYVKKLVFTIILLSFIILIINFNPVFAESKPEEEMENYSTYLLQDYYFAVEFDRKNNKMHLLMTDGSHKVLEHKKSASGARYTDEEITFWNKGDRAQLIIYDIIIDAVKVENITKKDIKDISDKITDDMIVYKNNANYLMFQDKDDSADFIISGDEFQLKEEKRNVYKGHNIKVSKEKNNLIIEYRDHKFQATKVKLKEVVKNSSLNIKGLGQEPGWLMEAGDNKIKLEINYSQFIIEITESQFNKNFENNILIYDIKSSLLDFQIRITEKMHTDIMSGKKFPYTIKIVTPDKKLKGGGYSFKK